MQLTTILDAHKGPPISWRGIAHALCYQCVFTDVESLKKSASLRTGIRKLLGDGEGRAFTRTVGSARTRLIRHFTKALAAKAKSVRVPAAEGLASPPLAMAQVLPHVEQLAERVLQLLGALLRCVSHAEATIITNAAWMKIQREKLDLPPLESEDAAGALPHVEQFAQQYEQQLRALLQPLPFGAESMVLYAAWAKSNAAANASSVASGKASDKETVPAR